jgi:hypothetical protein
MYHLHSGIQPHTRVRFSADIDVAPYGVLHKGSTGVVRHRDDEVLTITLDRPLAGFGDTLYAMSDNEDVIAALALYQPGIMHLLRRPIRYAVAASLVVFMWEAALKPAVAFTAVLDPIAFLFNGLL